MCRPHFCSMKIPEDVRKYAAERFLNKAPAFEHALCGKAAEFRDVVQKSIPIRRLVPNA